MAMDIALEYGAFPDRPTTRRELWGVDQIHRLSSPQRELTATAPFSPAAASGRTTMPEGTSWQHLVRTRSDQESSSSSTLRIADSYVEALSPTWSRTLSEAGVVVNGELTATSMPS